MNQFQNLASISIESGPLGELLNREIQSHEQSWEPGCAVHASIIEYMDRLVSLIPALAEKSTANAAYVLRRSLRSLRRAAYMQTNEDASCVFDGLHAEPEKAVFGIVFESGAVTTAMSRKAVSDLGAYSRAIEANTEAAVVIPWVPTAKDNPALTTSRSWRDA